MRFRKGQEVHHYKYKKGNVKSIHERLFSITVQFSGEFGDRIFSLNEADDTLSDTPYSLVDGGFTKSVPRPEIAHRTPIFVRQTNEGATWELRYFAGWSHDNKVMTYPAQKIDGIPLTWQEYSLEIPLK